MLTIKASLAPTLVCWLVGGSLTNSHFHISTLSVPLESPEFGPSRGVSGPWDVIFFLDGGYDQQI